jgi:hypothetical protein
LKFRGDIRESEMHEINIKIIFNAKVWISRMENPFFKFFFRFSLRKLILMSRKCQIGYRKIKGIGILAKNLHKNLSNEIKNV